jgi:glycosyltransferase involved in cell wall biosynthesis
MRFPVRKVLFVSADLSYRGAARQLSHLAAGLPRSHFDVRVAVLGRSSPWAEGLRRAGLMVHVLGQRRPFDLRPYLELRLLVRSLGEAAIHVWGAPALRALVLSSACRPGRLLLSAALPPAGAPPWLDRWLLGRVGGVAAFSAAEAERYRRLGVSDERLTVLRPGVEAPAPAAPAALAELPPTARLILGIGPMERHKGFREAAWAFDILAHLHPELHLVIVGAGSGQRQVVDFARAIGVERVHFVGPVVDVRPWLARAELVWVPGLREGGHNAALEAMAAGVPVVASRTPGLAELVVEGETGLLVTPDDKADLARTTHLLLESADLRRRLGEAGRRWAEQFSVAGLVREAARLYED